LGGAPGVAETAAANIRKRWPGAVIGVRDGYFDVARDEGVRAEIAAFRPDILFVGMGMPRQEEWTAAAYDALPPCVVFTVGAAFDYEAEVVPTPPRWTGRMGLEWLWRFGAEPKRRFTRYFVEPWLLIPAALGDLRERLPRPQRAELGRQV
jgi:N-acetylglucosaminyldiphosphoundecaprenol N-acetyl-beta-D-mannosaminyltransferase